VRATTSPIAEPLLFGIDHDDELAALVGAWAPAFTLSVRNEAPQISEKVRH
jgi:hypothetical protein